MSAVHDFKKKLDESMDPLDEPLWERAYRQAFPNFQHFMLCHGNHESQRRGMDRIVLLTNGTILKFDQKTRKEVHYSKAPGHQGELDFLLEYISNDRTGAPGWIEKDLDIDYLAYCWRPLKRIEFLPWWPLRTAWKTQAEAWKSMYQTVPGENPGYTTIGVAVPRSIVYLAIENALLVLPQQSKNKQAKAVVEISGQTYCFPEIAD